MSPSRLLTSACSALAIACATGPSTAAPPPTPAAADSDGHEASKPKPAESHLKVGAPAPPFKIRKRDRSMVRLDELAYPGREKRYAPKRPVLLDFFRTDCEPCVRALPQLVELHDKHADRGLEIVLVALLEKENGRAKLDAFLAGRSLPFTVVTDPSDHVAEKYMGEYVSLPATFLIDRQGVLRKTKFDAKGELETHLGDTLAAVLREHAEAKAK